LQRILLINPNSSAATTEMMVAIACGCAPAGVEIVGATATRSPAMIVTPQALVASAPEVAEIGARAAPSIAGIIVGAFGDPGLDELRARVSMPVVGLCEASMREAGAQGRRFGVATVTPELAAAIADRARALGLTARYTGIRLTTGDPVALAADSARLDAALVQAVAACFDEDGAEAVIIGGGPLARSAATLARRFGRPIIAPIPAAVRRLAALLAAAPH
jgi:allantoin racemase